MNSGHILHLCLRIIMYSFLSKDKKTCIICHDEHRMHIEFYVNSCHKVCKLCNRITTMKMDDSVGIVNMGCLLLTGLYVYWFLPMIGIKVKIYIFLYKTA